MRVGHHWNLVVLCQVDSSVNPWKFLRKTLSGNAFVTCQKTRCKVEEGHFKSVFPPLQTAIVIKHWVFDNNINIHFYNLNITR